MARELYERCDRCAGEGVSQTDGRTCPWCLRGFVQIGVLVPQAEQRQRATGRLPVGNVDGKTEP
jgi:hypothetical protein